MGRMIICLMLLACRNVSAAEDRRLEFSGAFLVAVEGPAADVDAIRADDFGTASGAVSGWRAAPLLVSSSAEISAADATTAPARAREWLVFAPRPETEAMLAARPEMDSSGWDVAHAIVDGRAPAPFAALSSRLFGSGVELANVADIEPDVAYDEPQLERAMHDSLATPVACGTAGQPTDLQVCTDRNIHWPYRERFAWHLEDEYSELESAREVQPPLGSPVVTIAHIDTGYSAHVANPPRLDQQHSADLTRGDPPVPAPGAHDPNEAGVFTQGGHGTRTMSVLSGGHVRAVVPGWAAFDGDLGGASAARVVEYRVGDRVVHLRTTRLVAAFQRAIDDQVDVISMSMGGLPSRPLKEVVNKAFDCGIAMFTASGNHLKAPLLPVATPTSIVYPARFERVVAVVGATADRETYAFPPSYWSLLRGQWGGWTMRGNFGPAWAMEEAIAGYTPNVSWALYSEERNGTETRPGHRASIGGGGTSAATPQVAAAAALWLRHHYPELAGKWRSCEKPEAVYRALLSSAEKDIPDASYSKRYFGAGMLKAMRALPAAPDPALTCRAEAKIGFDAIGLPLSVVPPSITGESDTNRERRRQLHGRMFGTELEQLVASSVELQEVVGDDPPEVLARDPKRLRRFLDAVRDDPEVSDELRRAITQQAR